MPTEAKIQLNQEGSGPKVRTLELVEPTAVSATGAAQADTTREQQIVGLSDRRGDLMPDVGEAILGELRAIRGQLAVISSQLE